MKQSKSISKIFLLSFIIFQCAVQEVLMLGDEERKADNKSSTLILRKLTFTKECKNESKEIKKLMEKRGTLLRADRLYYYSLNQVKELELQIQKRLKKLIIG